MRITRIIDAHGQATYALQQGDGSLLRAQGDPLLGTLEATQEKVEPQEWLPPIPPAAVLCIGLNYLEHVREGKSPVPDYPVLFMKNPSAPIGHDQVIRVPKVCEDEVDFEGELVVFIGRAARDVSEDEALDYVLGYTAGNDVSARIWQTTRGGTQWNRGKSFDTFAPMGPVLVTPDEIPDPDALSLRTELNGEMVQTSNTGNMIFPVRRLISFLSQDTTLLPGTAIYTGTPLGVGWAREPRLLLQSGDTVSVEIEGIGRLVNPVV